MFRKVISNFTVIVQCMCMCTAVSLHAATPHKNLQPESWNRVQTIIKTVSDTLESNYRVPYVLSGIILEYLKHHDDDTYEHPNHWQLVAEHKPSIVQANSMKFFRDELYIVAHNTVFAYDTTKMCFHEKYCLEGLKSHWEDELFLVEDSAQQHYVIREKKLSTRAQGTEITDLTAYHLENGKPKMWECFPRKDGIYTAGKTVKNWALSPQGSLIAIIEEGRRTVTVLDIATKQTWTLSPALKALNVAFSPNGKLLGICIHGNTTQATNTLLNIDCSDTTTSATEVWNIEEQRRVGADSSLLTKIALSNIGVVSTANEMMWKINQLPYPRDKDQSMHFCCVAAFPISSLHFSPDGTTVTALSLTDDHDIEIRKALGGEITSSSKYIAPFSTVSSEPLDVWSNNPQSPHRVVNISTSALATNIAFHPHNTQLAIGYNNGVIRLFQAFARYDVAGAAR